MSDSAGHPSVLATRTLWPGAESYLVSIGNGSGGRKLVQTVVHGAGGVHNRQNQSNFCLPADDLTECAVFSCGLWSRSNQSWSAVGGRGQRVTPSGFVCFFASSTQRCRPALRSGNAYLPFPFGCAAEIQLQGYARAHPAKHESQSSPTTRVCSPSNNSLPVIVAILPSHSQLRDVERRGAHRSLPFICFPLPPHFLLIVLDHPRRAGKLLARACTHPLPSSAPCPHTYVFPSSRPWHSFHSNSAGYSEGQSPCDSPHHHPRQQPLRRPSAPSLCSRELNAPPSRHSTVSPPQTSL